MTWRHPFGRGRQSLLADAVALKGLSAAIEQERLAVSSRQSQKREHHVLMIALEKHTLRRVGSKLEQKIDNAAGRRSAIDIVADEHDGVAVRQRERLDHRR